MSVATTALAGTVAALFTGLGAAKILAVPAMRERAAHVGMSTSAYRRIGALEVAGAAGVLVGLAEPRIGGLAGAGLLALLGGALIAHRRTGDGLREAAPALISAAAVAAYLSALWGRRSHDIDGTPATVSRSRAHARALGTWLEGRPQ